METDLLSMYHAGGVRFTRTSEIILVCYNIFKLNPVKIIKLDLHTEEILSFILHWILLFS